MKAKISLPKAIWPGLLAAMPFVAASALAAMAVIQSPRAGEAIQGQVSITGNSDIIGFKSAEISFAYADDSTQTWFLIAESDQAVSNGTLAIWDTTTITDGDYNLRLRVVVKNGSQVVVTIPDLRVRNYSQIETSTPDVRAAGSETAQDITPTSTLLARTPTSYPRNPAEIGPSQLSISFIIGGLMSLAGFIGFGYRAIRRKH